MSFSIGAESISELLQIEYGGTRGIQNLSFDEYLSLRDWKRIHDRLDELESFGDFGFEAEIIPPTQGSLHAARALIKELEVGEFQSPDRIVPSSDGGIVMEWQYAGRYMEADISDDGRIEWMEMEHDQDPVFSFHNLSVGTERADETMTSWTCYLPAEVHAAAYSD